MKRKKTTLDISHSEEAPDWFKKAKKANPSMKLEKIIDEEAEEAEFWETIRGDDAVDTELPKD